MQRIELIIDGHRFVIHEAADVVFQRRTMMRDYHCPLHLYTEPTLQRYSIEFSSYQQDWEVMKDGNGERRDTGQHGQE